MKTSHLCPKCKTEKDASHFQLYKGSPNGWCRSCRSEKERERRLAAGIAPKNKSRIEDSQKLCLGCNTMLPFTDFSKSYRGLGGLSSYCKTCFSRRYQDQDKSKDSTRRYRATHRERHLANHRVRMFERRQKIKVTDDGTVTEEFLKELYSHEHCHYCLQYTDEELRTADHKQALAKGGKHSAENLVMACSSCNSAKRDLGEEEFLFKGVKIDN